jgi:acyl carrier protein phosphodiesterase
MNYLAHAYLSFGHPEILVGNMISDFVKGRRKFDYPPGIQHGITLHRIIDTYTDNHQEVQRAKQYFRPYYRLYSGAFIDVIFDHFLAIDPDEFDEKSLLAFSQGVYDTLEHFREWWPEGFAHMFPYMKQQDWLFNYHSRQGTEKSLGGVVRRAKYLSESSTAVFLFEENYQPLQDCFRQFWSEARPFITNQFLMLTGDRS